MDRVLQPSQSMVYGRGDNCSLKFASFLWASSCFRLFGGQHFGFHFDVRHVGGW
jgi:hypothetical protein